MVTPQDILSFWMDDVGPKGWYNSTPSLDADICDRFGAIWQEAREGACGLWLTSPVGALGYIVLTDQLPRNMFRDGPDAFATDQSARAAAKQAIDRGWDMRVPEPDRQFFYLPLMHAENLSDQDRAVRLFKTKMPETGHFNLLDAQVHREIIRLFGRFPYRNAALGRTSTQAERDWTDAGGYAATKRKLQSKEPV